MPPSAKSARILVADDDMPVAQRVSDILLMNGFKFVDSTSTISEFSIFSAYDLIIIDIVWPSPRRPKYESSPYLGLTVLTYLRKTDPLKLVVLMSGKLFDLEHLAQIQNADGYFNSHANASEILQIVDRLTHSRSAGAPIGPTHLPPHQLRDLSRGLLTLSNILHEVEGAPSLLGLSSPEFDKIRNYTKELQTTLHQPPPLDHSKWKSRLDFINGALSGARNVAEIVEKLLKFFT